MTKNETTSFFLNRGPKIMLWRLYIDYRSISILVERHDLLFLVVLKSATNNNTIINIDLDNDAESETLSTLFIEIEYI